jgi:pre-mRNA cleavage complex 2 protein Pcf11
MSSAEIAEDYKSSLEDLTTNDGMQIRTLTVIAKENTDYAQAISRVLENHIRTVGALISILSFSGRRSIK